VDIHGYYINGYWWISMVIHGYYISGYSWLFMVIILLASGGYSINVYFINGS
jgi:hypothetical protein